MSTQFSLKKVEYLLNDAQCTSRGHTQTYLQCLPALIEPVVFLVTAS